MEIKRLSHRLTSLVLVLCLLLGMGLTSVSAADEPTITVTSVSGAPGDTVTISVDASNIPPCVGLSLNIPFDLSQFVCVESKVNPDLAAFAQQNGGSATLISGTGSPLIQFFFIGNKKSATLGHLFTATFLIKEGAQTTDMQPVVTTFNPEPGSGDPPAAIQTIPGTITVIDAPPVIPVESVTLDNNSLTLTEGDTGSLNASVNPDNATDKTVVWTSSDESVATVDQNGVVTAVAPGSAVITASAGGKSDSCEVTVNAYVPPVIPVESVTLDNNSLTLTEGDTGSLNASVNPDNATDKTVVWTSSDESVATVDQNGVVTAVAPGSAVITASAGGKSDSCEVTVNAYVPPVIPVESVTLDNNSLTLTEGDTGSLNVSVNPDNATDKTVVWT